MPKRLVPAKDCLRLVASVSKSVGLSDPTWPFVVGRRPPRTGDVFTGGIDEVQIYNCALGSLKIGAIYTDLLMRLEMAVMCASSLTMRHESGGGITGVGEPFAMLRLDANWLHLGDESAGPKVAAIISMVETCRRLDIKFIEYLGDFLSKLGTLPSKRVVELTTTAWKAARNP